MKSAETYQVVFNMFKDIEEFSGTNSKIELIKTYAENALFCQFVLYALNPYKLYKMSGNIKPLGINANEEFYTELFAELDAFAQMRGVTDIQKNEFFAFVQGLGDTAVDLVNRVLNKDLRLGANLLTFRKASPVFQKALPLHRPMKGEADWRNFMKRTELSNVCYSWKLDGTRTWAIVDISNQSVRYLSYNGLELPNFSCFDSHLISTAHLICEELQKIDKTVSFDKIIFDGEVIHMDGDFTQHMTQFRRLNCMDNSKFRFCVFDLVFFDTIFANLSFKQRYDILEKSGLVIYYPCITSFRDEPSKVFYLLHMRLNKHPLKLAKLALENGIEGIMLKTWSHIYQHKRSWDWCKVKVMHTEDLRVIGVKKGKGKYKDVLGVLLVERDGVTIEVGSGFTDNERQLFLADSPKMIEVKYQEVTATGSLRFPVFVRVRDDKS